MIPFTNIPNWHEALDCFVRLGNGVNWIDAQAACAYTLWMNQLELISLKSVPKEELRAKANRKHVPRRKRVMLRDADGRLIGTQKRSYAEVLSDFWNRVDKRGETECWEWIGGRNGRPPLKHYGIMWWGTKKYKTHRFSYEIHKGEVPKGKLVCHTCDNPPCVNPAHLYVGTDADNNRDKFSRGRANLEIGEGRYNAKLTEDDIREIRRRYKCRHPINSGLALAREFGIVRSMVNSIVKRRRWKHVV